MNTKLISKGPGKPPRLIYLPDATTKARLRNLLPALTLKHLPNAHGFVRGRSPVTNAKAHAGGWQFTLTADFQDFFDSITGAHLQRLLSAEIIDQVLVDGAPRQGLPTSPACANLAAAAFDADLSQTLRSMGPHVYTRYADDLAISFNDPNWKTLLPNLLRRLTQRHGFKIHPAKTRIQCASAGRRIITGIGVDVNGIHPPRIWKRRLRAARHHHHAKTCRGLEECLKLKMPKSTPLQAVQPFARGRHICLPGTLPS